MLIAQRQRLKGLSTVTLVTRTHIRTQRQASLSALRLLHSILLRAGCSENKCVTFQYFLELIPHLPTICECLSVCLSVCVCLPVQMQFLIYVLPLPAHSLPQLTLLLLYCSVRVFDICSRHVKIFRVPEKPKLLQTADEP